MVLIDASRVLRVVVAKYAFDGSNKADRLSLRKGETLDVLAEVSPEWWSGRNAEGAIGLFPSNYVMEVDATSAQKSGNSQRKATGGPAPGAKKKPALKAAKSQSFQTATLQDFPIQFKMPSQALPSLRIGANASTGALLPRFSLLSCICCFCLLSCICVPVFPLLQLCVLILPCSRVFSHMIFCWLFAEERAQVKSAKAQLRAASEALAKQNAGH